MPEGTYRGDTRTHRSDPRGPCPTNGRSPQTRGPAAAASRRGLARRKAAVSRVMRLRAALSAARRTSQREVVELHVLVEEGEADAVGRAVSLLRDDDLGEAPVALGLRVVVLAVEEAD